MELDDRDRTITPEERGIVKAVLGPMMSALAAQNENGLVSAGDVTRVLSFAIGAILETDDRMVTPRDVRQAGEYVGKLVAHHVKALRAEGEVTGGSFMADIVSHTIDER